MVVDRLRKRHQNAGHAGGGSASGRAVVDDDTPTPEHARFNWARVAQVLAAGLGLSIQADMTYRPWSLEGDIIEARPLVDLTRTLDVGLAWRRGTARPSLVDPFLTIAREHHHTHRRLSI